MNEMDNHALLAVSPIDGRYSRQTEPLRDYFSEYALIKYRVRVEIEYFIALCQIPLPQLADFDSSKFDALRDIYRNMTPEDAAKVKEIEKVTNHDVKAVEYFIKDRFKEMDILKWGEFVHFGLTSPRAAPQQLRYWCGLCRRFLFRARAAHGVPRFQTSSGSKHPPLRS